jgi:hypothetical protein
MAETAFGYLLEDGIIIAGDLLGNVGTPLTLQQFSEITDHQHQNFPDSGEHELAVYDAQFEQFVAVGIDPVVMLGPRPIPYLPPEE